MNFAWRVRARTGPLISMHSHLPLSCQSRSLKITAWKKKKNKQPNISLPPSLPHTSQPVIDTLTRGMNTSTKAEKRHLDSIACLGPLNSGAS